MVKWGRFVAGYAAKSCNCE